MGFGHRHHALASDRCDLDHREIRPGVPCLATQSVAVNDHRRDAPERGIDKAQVTGHCADVDGLHSQDVFAVTNALAQRKYLRTSTTSRLGDMDQTVVIHRNRLVRDQTGHQLTDLRWCVELSAELGVIAQQLHVDRA